MVQDARRAWILGGILLIAATVVVGVPAPVLWSVPGAEFAGPALFSAALLVFAFGLRGAGSVTARRPLGTVALVLLAVWTFADGLLWRLAPLDALSMDQQALLGISVPAVTAALATVAAVQIARAGVVPRPWNWAPLWALIAVIVPSLLQMLLVAAGPGSQNQEMLIALVSLDGLVRSAAGVFLGVMAILFATRTAPTRTVDIIRSERS